MKATLSRFALFLALSFFASIEFNSCNTESVVRQREHLVGVRLRRQTSASWQCPISTASSRPSKSLAFVAFYSPKSRQDVNVYQTRAGWRKEDIKQVIESGAFDLGKPSIIYTHGYTQTVTRPWLKEIRRNYDSMYPAKERTSEPQFNLMFYDWSDYGQRAYGTSVSFVPYLGRLLSQLIDEHLTRAYNYSANQIHVVSYSLSTHIAGHAGKKLKAANNPLRQITAVDPTGVCFHQVPTNFSQKYQLQAGDAKLVVARHYDMGKLGARHPIGGLDILVNGGSDQPSMSMRGQFSVLALMGGFGGASSHIRASQHEAEPFNSECHEIAYACHSYEAFLAGECADCGAQGNKCFYVNTLGNVQLGQDQASKKYKPSTQMHITTGYSQFCLHHYQVVAKLAKSARKADIEAFESGLFSVLVAEEPNADGAQVRLNPSHRMKQKGEQQFTQLLQLNGKVHRFNREIKVANTGKGGQGGTIDARSLDSLQINYMSNISPQERRKASARYCPKDANSLVQC